MFSTVISLITSNDPLVKTEFLYILLFPLMINCNAPRNIKINLIHRLNEYL